VKAGRPPERTRWRPPVSPPPRPRPPAGTGSQHHRADQAGPRAGADHGPVGKHVHLQDHRHGLGSRAASGSWRFVQWGPPFSRQPVPAMLGGWPPFLEVGRLTWDPPLTKTLDSWKTRISNPVVQFRLERGGAGRAEAGRKGTLACFGAQTVRAGCSGRGHQRTGGGRIRDPAFQ
jgi:hypothetical protein